MKMKDRSIGITITNVVLLVLILSIVEKANVFFKFNYTTLDLVQVFILIIFIVLSITLTKINNLDYIRFQMTCTIILLTMLTGVFIVNTAYNPEKYEVFELKAYLKQPNQDNHTGKLNINCTSIGSKFNLIFANSSIKCVSAENIKFLESSDYKFNMTNLDKFEEIDVGTTNREFEVFLSTNTEHVRIENRNNNNQKYIFNASSTFGSKTEYYKEKFSYMSLIGILIAFCIAVIPRSIETVINLGKK